MARGDRDARILQDATGARYMVCLTRVRDLRRLANPQLLNGFIDRVEQLPDLQTGQSRCVTCLGLNAAGVNDCVCQ